MLKRMNKTLLVLGCLVFLAGALSAESFTFQADKLSSSLAKGRESTILSGNARIVSDTITISADRIELYGKDQRYAICSGHITAIDTSKGIFLSSQDLFFDRSEETFRIETGAIMEDKENKLVVKGGYLEHRGKENMTIIQIGVRILKEDIVCRSEFARYRRDDSTLELSGNPFVQYKGDDYKASRIIINLDNDEIVLEGSVSGVLTTSKGEPDSAVKEPGNAGE